MVGGVVLLIISGVLWSFSVAVNVSDATFDTLLTYAPYVTTSMGALMIVGGGLSWATKG